MKVIYLILARPCYPNLAELIPVGFEDTETEAEARVSALRKDTSDCCHCGEPSYVYWSERVEK